LLNDLFGNKSESIGIISYRHNIIQESTLSGPIFCYLAKRLSVLNINRFFIENARI